MSSALQKQEGGSHYKEVAIQPVEYIHANNLGFFEGSVIKYVTRWKKKGGIQDLKKAIHFLELLIELEQKEKAAPEIATEQRAETAAAGPKWKMLTAPSHYQLISACCNYKAWMTVNPQADWIRTDYPRRVIVSDKRGEEKVETSCCAACWESVTSARPASRLPSSSP
jgi:hypothetical protein